MWVPRNEDMGVPRNMVELLRVVKRGEWHYITAMVDGDKVQAEVHEAEVRRIASDPKGGLLAPDPRRYVFERAAQIVHTAQKQGTIDAPAR